VLAHARCCPRCVALDASVIVSACCHVANSNKIDLRMALLVAAQHSLQPPIAGCRSERALHWWRVSANVAHHLAQPRRQQASSATAEPAAATAIKREPRASSSNGTLSALAQQERTAEEQHQWTKQAGARSGARSGRVGGLRLCALLAVAFFHAVVVVATTALGTAVVAPNFEVYA
jgi:hypothetical protein